MRRIKEFAGGSFRPDVSNRGGFNFAHGRMGPSTDADSTYSRRSQMISSKYDKGDLLLSDEEEEGQLNESAMIEMIQRLIIDVMLSGIDIFSAETLGPWLLPPRLATNIAQLFSSNKKAIKLLEKEFLTNDDLKKLKKIRSDLGRDIVDIFTAFAAAFPDYMNIENALDVFLSQFSDPTSKFIADKVLKIIDSIGNPTIKKLLYIGSSVFGGPIIYKSLLLIQEIDKALFSLTDNDYHRGGHIPTPIRKKEDVIDVDVIDADVIDDDIEDIDLEDILVDDDIEDLDLEDVLVDDDTEITEKIPKKSRQGKVTWPEEKDPARGSVTWPKNESLLRKRVYRNGRYMIQETLENIRDEDELDEMVSGGTPGVAVPMGYTSKGKPETPTERKKRQKFNREKSYPYK
jgi:hypothetical protein